MPRADAATLPGGLRRPATGSVIAAGVTVATIVLILLLPSLLSDYMLSLAIFAVAMGFSSLSIGVVSGRAGMMSLCQLSFGAIGAWSVAYLNEHGWHLPTPLMIVVGGLAAMPVGAILAVPALRVRGINLAIITLGFASFADTYFTVNQLPGQDIGLFVQRTGWFETSDSFFVISAFLLLLAIAMLAFLDRRPIGSAWLGIRHSERAAAAFGVSVPWAKISSFALSAFIAGMAGAVLLLQNGIIAVDPFTTLASLIAFAVAIMVGSRYPEGAVIAGVFAAFTPEILKGLGISTDWGNVFFGIGMIGALVGGAGMAEGWRIWFRMRQTAKETAREEEAPKAPVVLSAVKPVAVASDAPIALDVSGLTVKYGTVVALQDVDLRVAEGSVHALIGPNGAGKSTLVDAVSGFLPSYEGTISLGDKPIDSLGATKRARAGLRRTFQQGLAIPTLTVHRYLQLSAHRVIPRDEAIELMEFLDGPPPHRMIADIDVGSRRIVELAANLAARPNVLLLDEPGAGLAEDESRLLGARLAEFPERFGCAVLLIDHDMELVQASCSAITVLDFGKVIASGEAEEVLAHTAVIDAYLGASEEASLAGA